MDYKCLSESEPDDLLLLVTVSSQPLHVTFKYIFYLGHREILKRFISKTRNVSYFYILLKPVK